MACEVSETMEKLCAFLREKLAACEEQDEAKSSSAYEQVLRGSIRRLKEEKKERTPAENARLESNWIF